MLGKRDIVKELGKNIYIHPFAAIFASVVLLSINKRSNK